MNSMTRKVLLPISASVLTTTLAMADPARKVIIDQDAFEGPGMQPMLMLIQSPEVEVLGITIESGDAWQKEQTQATLRMLEMIGRTDIPVASGTTHPLVNSQARMERRETLYGAIPYKGAWTKEWPEYNSVERRSYHPPDVVPETPFGKPTTSPIEASASEFMLDQTQAHPGEVSIIAMGPLTNIAIAQRLDEDFARRAKEITLMGGGYLLNLPIDADHDEFEMQQAYQPRASFNFYWDPEAAHIVLTSPWERISIVSIDAVAPTRGSREMLATITEADTPVADYVDAVSEPGFPLWDETQAAVWLEPDLVERRIRLAADVNTTRGPGYGHFLTWPAGEGPGLGENDVELILGVDVGGVEALFTDLLSR